jgi:YegS/Rv2252/BmrU family lipid kinase
MSQGPLTATSFVRQALRAGADTVVAVGGDGTVNEAVNGFYLDDQQIRPGASLAIVPAGSSSDLARSLGVPTGRGALDALATGHTVPVDVGRAAFTDADGRPTVRHFLNNADVGIGARIADRGTSWKRMGGRAAFGLASLEVLARPDPWQGTLGLDDATPASVAAVSVVVALGPYTGGGMHVAPGARHDDGWFDVVTIGAMSAPELLANLVRVYLGTHLSHPSVQSARARVVRIATTGRPPIELDGEVVGVGGAEFRILSGDIPIHVGQP